VTVVIDTSILIDHLRGDPGAHAVLTQAIQSHERLVASVLTRAEVLAGMRSGEEVATYRLLSVFEWFPVDQAIAERAGEMARRFLGSHPGVDLVDFVIAATSEQLAAELWTRNIKHFPMLERVRNP
jgi:predicted nucleic acid-binding protein